MEFRSGTAVILLFVVALYTLGCTAIAGSLAQNLTPPDPSVGAPTCSGQQDCELKWARALDWVQTNSCWKLRNTTETLITTEGPLRSTDPAFEISKFPHGDGSYEIRFRAGCGNMFGCVPSINACKEHFQNYVANGGSASMGPRVCGL